MKTGNLKGEFEELLSGFDFDDYEDDYPDYFEDKKRKLHIAS